MPTNSIPASFVGVGHFRKAVSARSKHAMLSRAAAHANPSINSFEIMTSAASQARPAARLMQQSLQAPSMFCLRDERHLSHSPGPPGCPSAYGLVQNLKHKYLR